MSSTDFDVAVLGGGLAGLTAALQLQQERPATRIIVLEKQTLPHPDTAFKVGESIAEVAAHYLKSVLGLDDYLKENHLAKMGLRFFCSSNGNTDITRRVEYGLIRRSPLPNFHLDRGRLENKLSQLVGERGIEFLDGSAVTNIDLASDRHTVTVGRGGDERSFTAKWLIDASGRAGLIRHKMGLGTDAPIDVNACWFRTPNRLHVDHWTDDEAWQAQVPVGTRWKSTNSFVGEGYWVWVINLASGATSVGVVADPAYHSFDEIRRYDAVLKWLAKHEPLIAADLPPDESELLDFRKVKQYSYGCRRVYSPERWCLTGEAALFLDPLYSTGNDFTAIGNTLLTDVIRRALDGEPEHEVQERLRDYNRSFVRLFAAMMPAFPGKLSVFRDPQATGTKVIWDNAGYFMVPLLLFVKDAITDMPFIRRLSETLRVTYPINSFMQRCFSEWASPEWDALSAGIPVASDVLLENLFYGPLTEMNRDELADHLQLSIRRLHTLSRDMVTHMCEAAGRPVPEPPYQVPPGGETGEELLYWTDYDRRTGPASERALQPADGWMIR
jgi:flavin-dependent dehydrogenase